MISPIKFESDRLLLLDQRLLPEREEWVGCGDAAETAAAIRAMVVRGAPAIGVTAAYGLALAALAAQGASEEAFRDRLAEAGERLEAARPTAVNLAWAVRRLLGVAERALDDGQPPPEVAQRLLIEARALHEQDVETNRRIGHHGSLLVPDGARVLTHCNAGALATAGYGTALGVVRAAVEDGKRVTVIADETRPYLQGARLTTWELAKDGIPVQLITDGMAGALMARGEIDLVVVGADRIARNGDVANKIGTYPVAVLARRHGIPFYVAAPVSTIDPETASGAAIPIEERDAQEVLEILGRRIAPEGITARHLAFDVTPASLVTAIITEEGIVRAPYGASLARALGIEIIEPDGEAASAARPDDDASLDVELDEMADDGNEDADETPGDFEESDDETAGRRKAASERFPRELENDGGEEDLF